MKNPDPKKSRSRYVPVKQAFPDLTINARDIEILRLVHKHRFLDTSLIWHLLETGEQSDDYSRVGKDGKKRPAKYGFGQKALYKRLQLLFHGHYLARHFITDLPMGRGYGAPKAIYGLGSASARVLPDYVGETSHEVRRIVESNKVKSHFLRHALAIASFRAILELACKQSGEAVKLLTWEQGNNLRDTVDGSHRSTERPTYSVYPDAFFALEIKGKGKAHFFLEVDRGTMSIIAKGTGSDIRKKILGYYWYHERKKYSERYVYINSRDNQISRLHIGENIASNYPASDITPIRGFRILFLVPGQLASDGNTEGRLANILSSFPQFGEAVQGLSLYWFSPLNILDINRPESIFGKIWKTPNPQKGLQSLIE